MSFTPYDRPVRAAFIGLGRIYDLNMRAYVDNPDVEVVALVDPSEERRAQRAADWPGAQTFASAAELAASGLEVDAVEALLPIPLHEEGVIELLGYGWHVNLQKPMANDLASAQRMVDAAVANDRLLRVMENYIFYEPLLKLKALATSGDLGDISGYHMKMVGSGRGGWDVPMSSYEYQFQQMKRGRGILVFDDGWHKLATAIWLFGPIKEVRAWVGGTEVFPGIEVDAPTMIAWQHDNGIRGCGTSRWPPTCTCARTTTRMTSAGRSPADPATPASTAARAGACNSRASRCTSTAKCARTTPSTTTGAAASGTRGGTGCVGSTPARGPCSGAPRRPWTSCGSPSPSTPAARRAARAWTRPLSIRRRRWVASGTWSSSCFASTGGPRSIS